MGDTSPQIRVLIADNHPLFREGLRLLLEADPHICVIGEAADGHEAVELTRRLKPNVTLLDLNITHCSGMEALELIQRLSVPVYTLILAKMAEEFQFLEVLRRGGSGLVLKESTSHLLRKSIHTVMAGQYWIGRRSISDLVRELMKEHRKAFAGATHRKWRLTPRENQIVAEIISGKTNKEIAQDLELSEQTVKHHLTSIFDKVGASSRLELALMVRHFSVNDGGLHAGKQENAAMETPLHRQGGPSDVSVLTTPNPLSSPDPKGDASEKMEKADVPRVRSIKPERRSAVG